MRMLSIIFIATLSFVSAAYGQRLVENYISVRGAAMGNAYSAVVDDMDAIFYNPAALMRSSGLHWDILNLQFGIGNFEAIQKFQNLGGDFQQTINDLSNENFSLNLGGKTGLQLGGFAFYVYENMNLGVGTSNPVSPQFDISYINDIGYGMSFAFPIIPSIMAMGVSTKYIRRNGNRFSVSASTLGSSDMDYLRSLWDLNGTGYGLDTGLLFRIPGPISPTISLAWKNIGGTTFKATTSGNTAPPADGDEISVGAALNINALLISFVPSIELKHVGDSSVPFGKKLHAGFELNFLNLAIRGGLNQGYWAAGIGLGLGPLDIDIASYGVELGSSPGQIEDRRYMIQIDMGLGMDFGGGGSSGFSSSSGGGDEKGAQNRVQRRLKKRR